MRLAAVFFFPLFLRAGAGSDLSKALRSLEVDPAETYQVRDLEFARGDVRFFLTAGILAFSTPVDGSPVGAVFSSAVDAGEGEVILLPPTLGERKMLSARAGSPNIDEKLREAVFIFADNTAEELLKAIHANPSCRKDAAQGQAMAARYTPLLQNLVPKFETRLVLDLLNSPHGVGRYFVSVLGAISIGNFEVIFDRTAPEQIVAGQLKSGPDANRFDIWTSFTPKSLRGVLLPSDFQADHYRMDSVIDANLHMHIATTLEVRELHGSLRALSFDMSRQMRVLSAEVDGQPAEVVESEDPHVPYLDSGDREFVIVPASLLAPDKPHTVKVLHEGDVITKGPGDVFYVGSRGRWYPHRSLSFALFDMKFRFPKDLDLVAPGESVLNNVEGDQRIIERRTNVPLPMAGFNLGRYKRTTVKRGQFTVEVCANPENSGADSMTPLSGVPGHYRTNRRSAAAARDALTSATPDRVSALANDIGDVMEFYTDHFGPPPLNRLFVTPIPGRFGQGFGGIIYLSTMAYMRPTGKAFSDMDPQTRIFFTDLMHAHEVAHQWWGNLVLTGGYHDEWITEALANYSAMLYMEERSGSRAIDTLLETYRASLLDKDEKGATVESAGPVTQGQRIEASGKPGAWIAVMYGKGTWIMRMLQARMGEEAFWKMLAELRRRYEHKTLTTDEFRLLCAGFMPVGAPDRKLEAFFDQWVWGTGIPQLTFTSRVTGKPPSVRVTGTLEQSGVDDDFSADFPVEVDLRGKKVVQWIRSSSEPAAFSLSISSIPLRIGLDPGNQFLKK